MKSSLTSFIRNNPCPVFLLALLLAICLSLSLGATAIPLPTVIATLCGRDSGTAAKIVLLVRLPRTLGCVLCGAALSVAGCVIQTVLNNPLAGPNIMGVNTGAGLGVAWASALFPASLWLCSTAAFLGALFGTLLVLFIARRGGASRTTLLLSGMAVSAVFSALIDGVLSFYPAALNGYTDFRIGGMANVSDGLLRNAAFIILPSLLLCCCLHRELDILALGSDTARGLGLRVDLMRTVLLVLAAALVGAAVSVAGLIGFVGLLVPHGIRRLVGESSKRLLPCGAIGGAAFLTLCDLLARTLFAPYELSVGIVLSVLGGPFFLLLLLGQRKGRSHA